MIDAIPVTPRASRAHAAANEGEHEVQVRLLLTVPELQQAELLLRGVWGSAASETPLALDMCIGSPRSSIWMIRTLRED